jgi:HEPN domain-containing protein
MVKYFRDSDAYSCKELLHAAADHLYAADLVYESGLRCLDSARYLAQLGVELLLKAMLLHLGGQFPLTHNLEKLYHRIVDLDASIKLDNPNESILAALNKYYNLRYPQPKNMPGIAQGDAAAVKYLVDQGKARIPDSLVAMLENPSESFKSGRQVMKRNKPRSDA